MRAVVFKATREVAVEDVPDARVERDDDVVVRVTSSALCGTDLHMYDGRTGAVPGMVLGHEGLGIVEDVGRAVRRVQRGDRVVLPAHIYCGVCFNCARGDSAACLRVHPGHVGGAYAMPGMGPFRGSQAELVRVPFADANCVVLPGAPGDEHEDDFVLIADAWVTGWRASELAGVRAFGHDLQRRIGRAPDHRHAHEIVAEALHLGLNPLCNGRDVGHSNSALEPKRLLDRSRGAPASGI